MAADIDEALIIMPAFEIISACDRGKNRTFPKNTDIFMLCGSNKCAVSPIVVDLRRNMKSSRRYIEYRVIQLSRSAARKCLSIIVIFE